MISTESDIDILLKIRTSLKKLGHKVVQVVLGDLVEFSLKNACGLFCTPEDVRLAIAIGKRAGKFADYFCKIKGCTSVIVADNYQDYFAPTLFIKTNNGADKIFSNSKKAVIFHTPGTLCIHDQQRNYTPEYVQLVKEFYLKM